MMSVGCIDTSQSQERSLQNAFFKNHCVLNHKVQSCHVVYNIIKGSSTKVIYPLGLNMTPYLSQVYIELHTCFKGLVYGMSGILIPC